MRQIQKGRIGQGEHLLSGEKSAVSNEHMKEVKKEKRMMSWKVIGWMCKEMDLKGVLCDLLKHHWYASQADRLIETAVIHSMLIRQTGQERTF